MSLSAIKVKKRNAQEVHFNVSKIEDAIKKAFMAVKFNSAGSISQEQRIQLADTVTKIANSVNKRLSINSKQGTVILLEDIQDQVELALMRSGEFDVAKAYVLYREQRARQREQSEKLQASMGSKMASMQVCKRNGTKEPVCLDKITNRVRALSHGLDIDPIVVAQKAVAGLFDGITTNEIDTFLSETAAALTVENPDYSFVAARIKVNALHKETDGFISATQALYGDGLLNEEYYNMVMQNADAIGHMMDYDRDYHFDYFALTTLIKAYLLRVNDTYVERPQDMFMRSAITCGCGDTFDADAVQKTYDMMTNGYYTHATPTLFNSGLKMQQLSSCFLVSMEDDSIEGIFNTVKDCALISKTAGGIGLHAHNIRGSGSLIKSTNGKSNGLIPFLKIFNETARSVDQGGGKRKGSFAVYLEPWHADIEAFLELRKNTGAEEFRARDLFYALWIPDLFMQRVENDGDWTLMSENECSGLSDTYGAEFNALYEKYEANGKGTTIKARDLMAKIIEAQVETGQPYMLYKDSINEKSNQKNVGVIKSSNLCAEIVEYSDDQETAVCNLASIALPKFVTNDKGNDKGYDYQKLYEVSRLATRNLNRVIDINYYPTPKTERSNMRHRPIGLGIQGLADVFFKMKIAYGSEQAREVNKKIFETIYFGAVTESMEIAKTDGPYETYAGSPISQGQFQFDLWGASPSGMWDWDTLRADIAKYGVRNALTTACMPTASTGIILGNTETFQVQTSNIYKRQTLSGEFLLVNRYLVKELMERQLWTKEMRDTIIVEDGSIQNIPNIPNDVKEIYKTVWETSQKIVIDMAADRSPYIDQTQSMNLWLAQPTFPKVGSMHMYAWKKGLKTGMYYLRSRSAVNAVQMTVSGNKSENSETEDCVMCSA